MSKMTEKLDRIKTAFDRLNKLKDAVINGVIDSACISDEFYYWPLCLDDERDKTSFEIDTCSTSYCVSTLATMKSKGLSSTLLQKIDERIQGGLKTLLKLRHKDGTFPPVIFVEKLKKPSDYKGGIAISDNYFALSALIDAGFLNEDVSYDFPKELQARVKFIFKTIEYFKDTMVYPSYDIAKSYGGWYYTNEQNKQPVFLTTANVVLLLTKTSKILSKYDYDYLDKINSTIQEILKKAGAFLEHVLPYNSGNGVGVSAVHSCKMVDAMISMHKSRFDDNIMDTLDKIILPNCNDDFLNDTYQYSERYQILDGNKKYQNILHESYPESIMLFTLINVIRYSMQQDTSKLFKDYVVERMPDLLDTIVFLMNKLIGLNQWVSDKLGKLFKSHIRRNDGDFPIYASVESYKAINAWAELSTLFDSENADNNDLDMYVVEQLNLLKGDYCLSEQENELIRKINKIVSEIDNSEAHGNFSTVNSKAEAETYRKSLRSINKRIIARFADIGTLEAEYYKLIAEARQRGIITA